MSDQFEGVVKELLVTEFKVDEDRIGSAATFREMGLDSLDVVSLVMALEDRLSLEIPESDLDGVNTFGDALALIERKVGAGA
jgi:acyl carrier protein